MCVMLTCEWESVIWVCEHVCVCQCILRIRGCVYEYIGEFAVLEQYICICMCKGMCMSLCEWEFVYV